MNISERTKRMGLSPIRQFNPLAAAAKAAGKKIYHLNIGQPDIETPACFLEAVHKFNDKVVAYEDSAGYTKLLDSIIAYYGNNYNIELESSNIICTSGGSEALYMTFLSIIDPGDEVIMPEPFYTNYRTFVAAANGNIVPIETKVEEGYSYATREQIESVITPKTKAIACVTPGNPTGVALTKDEMKLILEIAKEHDLWVVADEVYREYVFDDREPASFAMFPEYGDRVILIDSVSKRFSSCGARVGSVISKNKAVMESVLKLAQGRLCSATIEQYGAAELYKLPMSYIQSVRDEYMARRDTTFEELNKIPGFTAHKPQGAFYLTCKLPVDNTEDLLVFLLTEFEDNGETVMYAPANGFYATPGKGLDEIRIAYVLNCEDMRRAAELLRLGIEAYNKKQGQ